MADVYEKTRSMRVRPNVYDRILEIKNSQGFTYSEVLETALDAQDELLGLISNTKYYKVGDVFHTDLAQARGEAVLQHLKTKQELKLPEIYVLLGQDDGTLDA